ncbi:putative transient receptor potential cation channel subfamily M member 3 [Apostichopus japonicus]|uniref:Putative transient receptor potential cation channel subfamily M member 3 n=1 Tax=Stichopus japonicus TaxID=307972 RepID=A0A2G8K2I9_STIJA|nr:putative transient receptor potential cation channel subfamily M member 3 [Apostichopus japonicus]WDP79903.1 transient receptor potential cation channel subfamily M member 3 [Apostichopus japonicus]
MSEDRIISEQAETPKSIDAKVMKYERAIAATCSVNSTGQHCQGDWVVPVAMAIYLIVANILFVNLLIAVFNNTFNQVSAIATQLWKYQRYYLTMKYEQKSILVPPFVLLDFLFGLAKYVCLRFCRAARVENDRGLKLFLPEQEVEKLRDFEEACLELYFREQTRSVSASNEERIRVMANGMEDTCFRLQEIVEKENHTRMNLISFDRRLMKLETVTFHMASALQGIHEILAKNMSEGGSLESLTEVEMGQRLREEGYKETDKEGKGQTAETNRSMVHLRENLQLTGLKSISGVEIVVTTGETSEDSVSVFTPASDIVFPSASPVAGTASSSPAPTFESQANTPSQSAPAQVEDAGTKGKGAEKHGKRSKKGNVLTRLSTFERYVSLVAPEEESQSRDEVHEPEKRQMGSFHGKPLQGHVHPSKLLHRLEDKRKGLRQVNSESNMSRLSDSSMQDYSTMPRPTPYVSAPAYTTITDHIDKSENLYKPHLDSLKGGRLQTGMDTSDHGYPLSPQANPDQSFFGRMKPSLRSTAKLENEKLEMEEVVCYNRMNQAAEAGMAKATETPLGEEDDEDDGIVFHVRPTDEIV